MRTRQQLRVHTPAPASVAVLDAPAIDAVEARWAAEAVGSLAANCRETAWWRWCSSRPSGS